MTELDPIEAFRDDHRQVRDRLFDIIAALQGKNVVEARTILSQLTT